jgi:hypothetical protein
MRFTASATGKTVAYGNRTPSGSFFQEELTPGGSAMRINWTEGAVPPLIVLALLAWVLFGAAVYALAS